MIVVAVFTGKKAAGKRILRGVLLAVAGVGGIRNLKQGTRAGSA